MYFFRSFCYWVAFLDMGLCYYLGLGLWGRELRVYEIRKDLLVCYFVLDIVALGVDSFVNFENEKV